MRKPKVLLIQEYIPHYRIAIFNLLADLVDLTVIYSEGDISSEATFKTLYIPKKVLPINIFNKKINIVFSKKSYYKIAKDFDVVICIAYYNWVDMIMMEYLPHKYKLIYWGIGVAASYGIPYDSSESYARKTCRHANKVDAMLFYSDYPVKKYSLLGVSSSKLFVANNTVQVYNCSYSPSGRNTILFIGTLYKDKGVDRLILSYLAAYKKNSLLPNLIIIGDGEERVYLENIVSSSNLSHKVTFAGKITDERILSEYFSKALICVSPNQAGLSVLKSMGYGVPYVTHKNAITGGEIFNIHDGIDGVLLNDFDELEEIINQCAENSVKFLKMGREAYNFYCSYRQPQVMVSGFIDAINFVLNNK